MPDPSLTVKQVEMLLGFLPDEFLVGFASALLERKPAGVLEWVRQLVEEGWDLPQFVRDFREFLRQTIVDQLSGRAEERTSGREKETTVSSALPLPRSPALEVAGRPVLLAEVLQMIKVMGQCVDEMRWNDNPRLVLELYSLRLTQPFVDAGVLLSRLEELEKRGGRVSDIIAHAPEPSLRAERSNLSSAQESGQIASSSPPTSRGTPRNDVQAPIADPPTLHSAAPDVWKRFLSELWKKPAIASHMERAHLKSAGPSEWVIGFADRFAMDSVQRSQAFLEETLAAVAGRPVKVRFVEEARDRREDAATVEVAPVMGEPVTVKDARVQKVLDVFKGKIRE